MQHTVQVMLMIMMYPVRYNLPTHLRPSTPACHPSVRPSTCPKSWRKCLTIQMDNSAKLWKSQSVSIYFIYFFKLIITTYSDYDIAVMVLIYLNYRIFSELFLFNFFIIVFAFFAKFAERKYILMLKLDLEKKVYKILP